MAIPVLYGCAPEPHSLRARLALLCAGLRSELREFDPDDPPLALPALPLLQLPSGKLLDHSAAILRWAMERRPELGLWPESRVRQQSIDNLILANDGPFAQALGNYREAARRLIRSPRDYRIEAEIFLAQLEARLARTGYLVGDSESLADIAILPFIHDFAEIDRDWFDNSPYLALRSWLNRYRHNPLWQQALQPVPLWRPGNEPRYLDLLAPTAGLRNGSAA
jgi:glutathione S-transferase